MLCVRACHASLDEVNLLTIISSNMKSVEMNCFSATLLRRTRESVIAELQGQKSLSLEDRQRLEKGIAPLYLRLKVEFFREVLMSPLILRPVGNFLKCSTIELSAILPIGIRIRTVLVHKSLRIEILITQRLPASS